MLDGCSQEEEVWQKGSRSCRDVVQPEVERNEVMEKGDFLARRTPYCNAFSVHGSSQPRALQVRTQGCGAISTPYSTIVRLKDFPRSKVVITVHRQSWAFISTWLLYYSCLEPHSPPWDNRLLHDSIAAHLLDNNSSPFCFAC